MNPLFSEIDARNGFFINDAIVFQFIAVGSALRTHPGLSPSKWREKPPELLIFSMDARLVVCDVGELGWVLDAWLEIHDVQL